MGCGETGMALNRDVLEYLALPMGSHLHPEWQVTTGAAQTQVREYRRPRVVLNDWFAVFIAVDLPTVSEFLQKNTEQK